MSDEERFVDFKELFDDYNRHPSVTTFGYIQCSLERYPRALCINEKMKEFIGDSEEGRRRLELLGENIFFMVPFEERETVRICLEQLQDDGYPVFIHHGIIRIVKGPNGVVAESVYKVSGSMNVIVDKDGNKRIQIFYFNLDEENFSPHERKLNSYFSALKSAYNLIFELKPEQNFVECIYGRDTTDIGGLYDVQMTIESAINFWVTHYVVNEDKERLENYLKDISTPGFVEKATHPLQTEFRLIWQDGKVYFFIGVAIAMDHNTILFCCRDTAKMQYSGIQAREISSARKLHHAVEEYFEKKYNARGAVILRKADLNPGFNNEYRYYVVFMSQSIRDYFNIRDDQYTHMIEDGITLEEIEVYASEKGIEDVGLLFSKGMLRYTDEEIDRSLIFTLNQSTNDIISILAMEDSPSQTAGIKHDGIFARTFGYFDLFVNGEPVVFSNNKEKELLALLIDRNGGTLTSTEAISFLWENATPTDKIRTRYRKLAMGLKNTLTRYGAEDILINHNGVRSVDTKAFVCDYYELLAGNLQYQRAFHNNYMTDYSWGERTLATLWDYS